ncbi:hypothetical protein NEPAR06_2547, partial [Nematocida parisii]
VIQFKKEYLDKTDHIKYSLPINLLNKYTK